MDRKVLRTDFRAARRRASTRALIFVLPLLVYLLLFFVTPLLSVMLNAVREPSVAEALPRTVAAISDETSRSFNLTDRIAEPFVHELLESARDGKIADVSRRLEYEKRGMSELFAKTVRQLVREDSLVSENNALRLLSIIDERWLDPAVWRAIDRASSPYTLTFILRALDMHTVDNGRIAMLEEDQRIHLPLLAKTFELSLIVTSLALVLAFTLAYFIHVARPAVSSIVLTLVVVSMWVSLLARTSGWIVLLQDFGPVSDFLVAIGAMGSDSRSPLVYNAIGTVIVMTHMMVPLMTLPIYTAMRNVPAVLTEAATSLGATPFRAFIFVFVPNIIPGIGVAIVLGFVLSVGLYIVPALVGGANGQLLSSMIAIYGTETLDLNMAAAVGLILLVCVMVTFVLLTRVVSLQGHSMGTAAPVKSNKVAHSRNYSMTLVERIRHLGFQTSGGVITVFLILPLLVIIPMSLSSHSSLNLTDGMLALNPDAFSTRWYKAILGSNEWLVVFLNSFTIALFATTLAVALGFLAAIGMSRREMPFRNTFNSLLLLPMISPIVITAIGVYFFYSVFGLVGSMLGVMIAHVALIVPPIVFNSAAALSSQNPDLHRAALSLGASPFRSYCIIVAPLVMPAIATGAMFAFIGSFDEPVIAQFVTYSPDQFTFPQQMFSGIRNDMDPSLLAAGVLILLVSGLSYSVSQLVSRRRQ